MVQVFTTAPCGSGRLNRTLTLPILARLSRRPPKENPISGIGEGIVPLRSFESWEPEIRAEEILECLVQSIQDVLQDLRIDVLVDRELGLELGELFGLFVTTDGMQLPLKDTVVIQLSTNIQSVGQGIALGLVGLQFVAIRF